MPSQGCNHLPNDQALGEAISFVSVALIEKEKTMVKPSKNFLQNRLNRLLTNVAAAWPQTPWKQEFPDWARRFDWSNEMVQVAERFGQSAPKTVRVASVAAQGTDKITTPGMKALGKPPETHVLIM
jgi:hypothetical protein